MIFILSHKTQINPNPQLKMLQLIKFCKEILVGDNRVHTYIRTLGLLERTDKMEMKSNFLIM